MSAEVAVSGDLARDASLGQRLGIPACGQTSSCPPKPGLSSKVRMTSCAQAISSAVGVKAALTGGTWLGWITILAANPSRRAVRASLAT